MGTGTSRLGLVLAALTLGLAGCGGAGSSGAGTSSARTSSAGTSSAETTSAGTSTGGTSGAGTAGAATGSAGTVGFSWLRPQAAPAGWRIAAISSGGAMAYPPSWKLERGDRGTSTAVLTNGDDHFLGYLNLTPRQGAESLSNWSSFRPAHNADEGDRNVKRLAAAHGLRFRDGPGACVKDSYTTQTGNDFVEIACLVAGQRGQAVIVAAAPPSAWAGESATLERAIEAVRT